MNPTPSDAATPVVSDFYDRFPYPGDPIQDGPPPGYNWRWCLESVDGAVRGEIPERDHAATPLRILDAGCGTGVSTDYLCHLNPGAEVLAVDISAGALDVARERLHRSRGAMQVRSLRQEQRSLLDLNGEGPFDYINSVGVLHHLREPLAGLKALAALLDDDGLMHLFLYANAGRWEIHRTQKALTRLGVGQDSEALRLGRELLDVLPESNRLRRNYEQRWLIDTAADANFADMYLHPQETSYDLETLFALIEASGLHFVGFSNPSVWDPARLLNGDLLARAQALPVEDQWFLIEDLDTEISHFEFFVARKPLQERRWEDDGDLLRARTRRQSCVWGWPSASLLGPDLEPIALSAQEKQLLEAVDAHPEHSLGELGLGPWTADVARTLIQRRLLLPLAEAGGGGENA
ncbi:phycobiliprotein asparagine methyltransferase [Synechococcus sp. MEDNS5]|uniref:class I SAM-dependent methyltransferase n=1 Tax=Synechococcus sp. MEDNS5 TaxID=1442554 RepID=UPI001647D5B6|nr:class I SAM-dependent methyltransferase [Synechococcus sp. MEDNS5]QNJ06942.1 phycobiliprotein asparagine methyltransferase [Synechococcus sp. MEDNS5]